MNRAARKLPDIEPDRVSLEIMHSRHKFNMPLDEMLAHPTFSMVIKKMAVRHMLRRDRNNPKAIAANN